MSEQIIFFLVRHGESECNVKSIANCLPEKRKYHLTEEGEKQIEKIAKTLKKKKIDAIISSPMQRTKETAEIISEATGIPVVYDERLQEAGLGVFNGRPFQEFRAKYPNPHMRIVPDPADKVESFIEMRNRLKSFLDDIQGKYTGKKMVVVSHGDPLEQLHGILVNESPGVSSSGWYPKKGECVEISWKG